jgi:hypothetical protein
MLQEALRWILDLARCCDALLHIVVPLLVRPPAVAPCSLTFTMHDSPDDSEKTPSNRDPRHSHVPATRVRFERMFAEGDVGTAEVA